MEDKARIQELVNELDGLIPSDGAVVRIYDGDLEGDDSAPHSLEVQGTPAGYLQVLCDLQDVTYSDAAAAVGYAVGTVRSRLHDRND